MVCLAIRSNPALTNPADNGHAETLCERGGGMGLFGFGKRKDAVRASRPASVHPSQPQIFPDEMWQGPVGDMLRAAGFRPDDESNFAPTPQSIEAKVARDKQAHEAKLAEINRDVAGRSNGGAMQAFFLIPEPCWNGEMGDFLLRRLQMSPYEDWNVAFLPTDSQTAALLGLPRHPLDEALLFAEDAEKIIRGKMAQLDAINAEVERTQQYGRYKQQKDDLKDVIRSFAQWLLGQYGEVWKLSAARSG